MKSNPAHCPHCQAALPSDAPGGLCPACLLQTQDLTEPSSPAGHDAPTDHPAPGGEFGGYRILRLLGRGGMGEVFEAESRATGRRVALKVIHQGLPTDAARRRFLREGRLAAAVNHPNVVYVYGSEEIHGAPAIAMELVRGGTLADRVRRQGPLSIPDAVHATLEIVTGLEASQSAGVLHRDIKPSNCFVSAEGTVKIGDFGLSVSTLARGESLLTTQGTVLGTPAYAAPEQLRGEELTVAADLYSVGATLFHLLTGRPPFQAEDVVQLIGQVLDKTPPSPAALRPEIPSELARVVQRCMAKDPKHRFQTYAELRDALLPFHQSELEPARPAQRFLAALIDDLLLASGPTFLAIIVLGQDPLDHLLRERTWAAAWPWLGCCSWMLSYFAISEGAWGAGLGKTLLGLRVVGLDRRLAGIGRALVRALLYQLPSLISAAFTLLTLSDEQIRAAMVRGDFLYSDGLPLLLFPMLFVTMRQRNGYAAIHDLISGTRVIRRPRSQPRPSLDSLGIQAGESLPDPILDAAPAVTGPYTLTARLGKTTEGQLLSGCDPALRRAIWVLLRPTETPAVARRRQDLSQPSRLRWLHGGTTHQHRWDAYDAPEGCPLLTLNTPVPWHAVRFWLLDLARELARQLEDPATVVPWSLDRVWITTAGRAVLLDFPCPGAPFGEARSADSVELSVAGLQGFLNAVARRALEGKRTMRPRRATSPADAPRAPVPLHARGFLAGLARQSHDRAEFIIGNLASLAARNARITPVQRAAALTLAPALLAGFGLLLGVLLHSEVRTRQRAWTAAYPNLPDLVAVSGLYMQAATGHEHGYQDPTTAETIRTFLRTHYASIIKDESVWANPRLTGDITKHERTLLIAAVQSTEPIDPAAAAEANETVPAMVRAFEIEDQVNVLFLPVAALVLGMLLLATVDLLWCLRGSPGWVFRLLGITLVHRDGRPAGRLPILCRWLVAWSFATVVFALVASPPLKSLLLDALFYPVLGPQPPPTATFSPLSLILGSLLLSVVWAQAIRNPQRAWIDRLSGTLPQPL
jgi:eukaryotic-like serine/threonine-protein kinase